MLVPSFRNAQWRKEHSDSWVLNWDLVDVTSKVSWRFDALGRGATK